MGLREPPPGGFFFEQLPLHKSSRISRGLYSRFFSDNPPLYGIDLRILAN